MNAIYKEKHIKELKQEIELLMQNIEGLETLHDSIDILQKFNGKKITIRIENAINEAIMNHSNKIRTLVKLSKNYGKTYEIFYFYPKGQITSGNYYTHYIKDKQDNLFNFEAFKEHVILIYKNVSKILEEKTILLNEIEKSFEKIEKVINIINEQNFNSFEKTILKEIIKGL